MTMAWAPSLNTKKRLVFSLHAPSFSWSRPRQDAQRQRRHERNAIEAGTVAAFMASMRLRVAPTKHFRGAPRRDVVQGDRLEEVEPTPPR